MKQLIKLKKEIKKIEPVFWFKAALLIVVFVIIGNFVAAQSGITEELSNLFYVGTPGEVAGEYSVRIAQSSINNFYISGDDFVINDTPTFLLGASLFDAINETEDNITADLNFLGSNHYNLIRVWADWSAQNSSENIYSSIHDRNSTVYNLDATLNSLINKLRFIIERAAERAMIVDVTILDTNPSFYGDADGVTQNPEPYELELAASRITTALAGYDNVIFDIYNEHDNDGGSNSAYFYPSQHSALLPIAEAVRNADPNRKLTVSSTGSHIVDENNIVNQTNIRDELTGALAVDFLTPHFSRSDDWYSQTTNRINLVKNYLNSINVNKPIYLQEEQAYPIDSNSAHFTQAVGNACQAGAAGWVFHSLAGLDLKNGKNLRDNLGINGRQLVTDINIAAQQCGSTPPLGGGNCNGGISVDTPLTSNPGSGIIVSGGNFSNAGWTTTGANNYIEYHFNAPFESGQIEFDISGLEDAKLTSETYDLFSLWDNADSDNVANNAVANNRSKSFLMIFGDAKGAGAYTGKIRPRLKVNNTLDGVDGNITGTATHDNFEGTFDFNSNSISGDSALAVAYDWNVSQTYGFRIVWGNGRLTYFFRESPSSAYYQIGEYDYSASGKEYNPTLPYLRLGRSDYGTVPGITFSNFKLICTGGTGVDCSTCGAWQSASSCGTGGCSATQRLQTRSGCPVGCQTSQCVADTSCAGGGGTGGTGGTAGAGAPLLIATNSRNPSAATDRQGNVHIAYDRNCSIKGNTGELISCEVWYVKYTCAGLEIPIRLGSGTNTRIATDANNNAHIVWGQGISGGQQVVYNRIVNGAVAWANGRPLYINTDSTTELEKPRIAVSASGQVHISFQHLPHISYLSFGINDNVSAFSETQLIQVDNVPDSDEKGTRQGGIVIDSNGDVHFSWSYYTGGGAFYRKYNFTSRSFDAINWVTQGVGWQTTSDFTSLNINKNNGDIVYAAQPGNVDNPSNPNYGQLLYGNLGTSVNSGERLSAYNFGTEVGLIDDGDNLDVETVVDTRNISYITFAGSNLKSTIEEGEGTNTAANCGDGVCDYNFEHFENGIINKMYCPRDCGHFAYYFTVNQSGVYSGQDALRLTPTESNNNQGKKATNPIPTAARNQGIYVVYEDNANNINYDAYLVSVDGADICWVPPALKADFNCDGQIDIIDFGVLLSFWQKTTGIINYKHTMCATIKSLDIFPVAAGDNRVEYGDVASLLGCWGTPDPVSQPTCYNTNP